VAGVVSRDGKPTVEGVQASDTLARVDGLGATNAPMGRVIDALRGTPGKTRTLLLERAVAAFYTFVRVIFTTTPESVGSGQRMNSVVTASRSITFL
jgi:hypothetical protein